MALCLLWLVFPGDVPFIGDEPNLIALALEANGRGELATLGLIGTQEVAYGPVPVWIYQILLGLSHDLVLDVALRAAACAVAIAVAGFWTARTLGLPATFVPVLLCSPFLWYYSRVPWDNSFAIPISALGFAAYVAFLRDGRPRDLALATFAAVALPLIHLMSLAFVIPIVLHALVFRAQRIAPIWWAALPIGIAGLVLCRPYLDYLRQALAGGLRERGDLGDLWFAARGAQLLGAWGIEQVFGPRWTATGGPWIRGLQSVSLIAVELSAVGFACALACVRDGCARRGDSVRAHAAALAVAIVLCQSLLGLVAGNVGFAHYFNATWFAYALLVWLAIDALARFRGAAETLCGLQAAASLGVLVFLLVRVHVVFPSREHYGATLANQVAVAAELERRADRVPLRVDVENAKRFPIALEVLRRLQSRERHPELPPTPLALVYASDHPLDGRMRLVEEAPTVGPGGGNGTGGDDATTGGIAGSGSASWLGSGVDTASSTSASSAGMASTKKRRSRLP